MTVLRRGAMIAAASATLGATACSQAMRGGDPGIQQEEMAMLEVENNHWLDVNVYVVRNGTQFRLGTIPSLGTARFPLTPDLAFNTSDLRLLFDPIGSSHRYLTDPVFVGPGEAMVWRVQNHLPASSYLLKPMGAR